MVGDDDEPDWHEQQPLIVAAGVAALILVALLVYAVIRTSDSSQSPATLPVPSSSATPSTFTTPSTSTTSYSVPRVTTSEDNPVVNPPPATPPSDGAADDEATEDVHDDHQPVRHHDVVQRRAHLADRLRRWRPRW